MARFSDRLLAVWAVAILAVVSAAPAHADRDALWRLLSEQCVPDQIAHLDPAPCTAVDTAAGYAVLKDVDGAHQFLLLPTARVTGLEDPAARDPLAPNYFAHAWQSRSFVEAAAGGALPGDWVSLAANSAASRSQDQLHIHIDCLRADVHQTLGRYAGGISGSWSPLPGPLAGRDYQAMRISDLDAVNPIALAAAGSDMSAVTLVVLGAGPREGSGFLVLRRTVDAANPGGGEELQDHRNCPAPLPTGPFTGK